MTMPSKASNSLEINGQVVGVYPSSRRGMPSGYKVIFYTSFYMGGEEKISETSIMVNTEAQLPEVNDVIKVIGPLNIYTKRDETSGKYITTASLTEHSRQFLKKGTPRPAKQKQQGGYNNKRPGGFQKSENTYQRQAPVANAQSQNSVGAETDDIPF